MAEQQKVKKRKFSVHQVVVFRFSDRKLVGEVIGYKPMGKRYVYDVLSENGKVYTNLDVDIEANECIDTYLTKMYYKKHDIDANSIPSVEEDEPILYSMELAEETEEEVDDNSYEDVDDGILFDEDDIDPNY